ncbi:MAG: 4-(cytidine 5'-diphospho)-2-C-methyl-D-erythritol kinase [Thermoflavifilum aggregans]|nr:4-(cytidine 5'-diphospho)-2-C-methyl-D-erythritol kinase [Thermoflavifilum aggregans]
MIAFSPAKINLGLHILSKRDDGYHDIETIFYPIPWFDAIEIISSAGNSSSSSSLHVSGIVVPGHPDDNLCMKAYQLVKQDFPHLPAVDIYLHKTIPAGTGLGGGSANAATMLQLLNKKFALQLSNEKLLSYARQLGSDCAFFLQHQPCYATGRGDLLEPIDVSLKGYTLVVVCPGVHVSTAWAYQHVQPRASRTSLKEWIRLPVETWKNHLVNDFEDPVFAHFPVLREIKQQLYAAGACYASMSGSGSAVFGLFAQEMIPSSLSFPDAITKICTL